MGEQHSYILSGCFGIVDLVMLAVNLNSGEQKLGFEGRHKCSILKNGLQSVLRPYTLSNVQEFKLEINQTDHLLNSWSSDLQKKMKSIINNTLGIYPGMVKENVRIYFIARQCPNANKNGSLKGAALDLEIY